jgi:mono/diheme cytochrome c family protein
VVTVTKASVTRIDGTAVLGRLRRFALLLVVVVPALAEAAEGDDEIARGRYLLHAAGCVACHTDAKGGGATLAGGRALTTPFGTFFGPNLTPDPERGLGNWSAEDFLRALRQGLRPAGDAYYPAFPYPAYSGMTEDDARAIWAYLQSLPPVAAVTPEHELDFPFGLRSFAGLWRDLYFTPTPFAADPERSEAWNRGAYLVRHLGHCAECHSPRGSLGAIDVRRDLAGTPRGPDGKKVPNITPHETDGIGAWSRVDLTFYLKTGFLPDGDFVGGAMQEVIRDGTAHLGDDDRAAIAEYLFSLPPLPDA